MSNSLKTWALLLCTALSRCTLASEATPLEFFEVVTVTPSRMIKHEVVSKGPFDDDRIETLLHGPQLFSQAVGLEHNRLDEPRAYLNWYEIAQAPKEPRRTIVVRDPIQGNTTHQINIRSPAFLLSPAQKISTGSPSPVPEELNYFKAYRILDAPPANKTVKLTGTLGPVARTATRAVFFCVPIEQWHHDEYFRVKNSRECLLVYELLPHKHRVNISTIDQFGLNTLSTHSSNWLCVRVTASDLYPTKAE